LSMLGMDPARAQDAAMLDRIQSIERQIRQLQQELQQVKGSLNTATEQLRQSQEQVKQQQEAVQQAQQQSQQAQQQVQQARQQVQQSQEAMKQAQEQAKSAVTLDDSGALNLGGIKFRPGGYIEAAGIYRTRNEVADVNTDFGGIPFKNQVTAHEPEFRGSARQSRISLLVNGDVDTQTHLGAYIESDFLGSGTTSNSRESNSYVPRLRQAYATVDLDRLGLHVLAGQSWSLLTTDTVGITPRSEQIPFTIDAQYVPGFNWTRNPQARIVKKFSDMVSAGLSVESPQAVFPPSPFATPTGVNVNNPGDSAGLLNSTTTYSNDIMPDFVGKVAFDPGWGHYELKALGRMFSDRAAGTSHYTWGYGGGFAATLPVIPEQLEVQISGLAGAGIGRYGSTQLPDVALSGSNTLVAIPEVQGLLGIIGHPWPSTQLYLYAGWEHADRAGAASTAGYGSPTLINTGCNTEGSTACQAETKDLWQVTIGAWQDLFKGRFGRLALGIQGSYTERRAFEGIGGGPNTNEGVVMTSLRYYPF
jgi:flagellar motor protein MotB